MILWFNLSRRSISEPQIVVGDSVSIVQTYTKVLERFFVVGDSVSIVQTYTKVLEKFIAFNNVISRSIKRIIPFISFMRCIFFDDLSK